MSTKQEEEFGIRHYQQLCELLELKLSRMPSDTTIRRMLSKVNFEELTQIFNAWAGEEFEPEAGEWVAVDGKSLKGTVQNKWDAFQKKLCERGVSVQPDSARGDRPQEL